eukprot:CAMPEP_0185726364 /NCGR_PEP_ID=MMETSP1171-20130828/2368_1 /TAXON_ID=374046 /ORGANISM="Helicotheca tamensis, Strain CCMP826" /LENGTH=262 /DNA_ID=CAMNT_0028394701 /DNA_START=70 /DNA_END=858 /DNA_ORIENTATION=+
MIRQYLLLATAYLAATATAFTTPSSSTTTIAFTRTTLPSFTTTRLYSEAEEEQTESPPSESTPQEENHGEHSGPEYELPSEEATDILNSPAFLKRKVDVLQSDIAAVEGEIDESMKLLEAGKAEWGQKLDDLQKEYQNIQDRMNKQTKEGGGTATVEVVRKMLEVLDNYDRAFGAITPETDEEKEIEQTYKDTYDLILKTFEELGVKAVETLGTEFDYEVHQAVMQRPCDEYEEGIVCEELARGWVLEDKLIRAAMVSVSAG